MMIIKIKNAYEFKKIFSIIVFFIILIVYPISTFSAELLQIKDVNNILIGDHNRSLYLSLYCIDIDENEKEKAIEILKRNFPKGTKVKIKPYGSNGDKLLAKIFRIDDETEMTELLNTFNSSKKNCVY